MPKSQKSKYQILPVEDLKQWDKLVDESPQGTIFSTSSYLDAANVNAALFFVYKGNALKAGIVLVLNKEENKCIIDDLVIYNGILFKHEPEILPVKARTERFKLTEYIVDELEKKYKSVKMALSPSFEDLRPFLWFNYYSEDKNNKYTLDLRYTSYLGINELNKKLEDEEYKIFWQMETVRRQMVRDASKKGASVRKGNNSLLFIRFYTDLMMDQGEDVDNSKLHKIQNIIDTLYNKECLFIYEVCNKKDEVIYILIYAIDNKRAYYLFGAGILGAKSERYQGTIAHWEAFKDLAQNHNITEVDLEGVNSPQRGWFKLGFGGDIAPYYEINFKGGRNDGKYK